MKYTKLLALLSIFTTSLFAKTELQFKGGNHIEVVTDTAELIDIKTIDDDPFLVFTTKDDGSVGGEQDQMLAFEYFCPDGTNSLEVFYSKNTGEPEWSSKQVISSGRLTKAEAWQPFAIDLKAGSNGHWTKEWAAFRIDIGSKRNLKLQIRNVHLRPPTPSELKSAEMKAQETEAKLATGRAIQKYLADAAQERSPIHQVSVTKDHVLLSGITDQANATKPLHIVEYLPHEVTWEAGNGKCVQGISISKKGPFEIKLPRYHDGRDRLTHRFAIATKNKETSTLIGAAQWATDVSAAAERSMPRLYPSNKKGLGGIEWKDGIMNDLEDLGITSITVNLLLHDLLEETPEGQKTIEFKHDSRTWHYNPATVAEWDKVIQWASDRDIVVSAILLITEGPLQHPDYDPAGLYAMPNLTDLESTDAYRAILSFIAERYSRPDKEYGWISHWILHNEIDYAWTWTNMGEQVIEVYLEHYIRSMRLAWLEARRYNPTAEVFMSLTHSWDTKPSNTLRAYPPRRLVELLNEYNAAEGDFHWGLAYHPYPSSLLDPRTWNDPKTSFAYNTTYITPRNIEVLDAFMHKPEMLYKGEHVRTVLLSEQGFHTSEYTEEQFTIQSAAFAYTWQKILPLKSIETFHNHRWVDHPREGGLKLGVRTLPDIANGKPFGVRKPAFDVFAALETDRAAEVTEPLKAIIGITEWSEVNHTDPITEE